VSRTIWSTSLSASLNDPRVKYGSTVKVQGELKKSGKPVARATVSLYRKSSSTWQKVDATQTSRRGSYSFSLQAKTNAQLQVRSESQGLTFGSQSPARSLHVAKVLKADVKDGTIAVGQTARFAGRVFPTNATFIKMEIYYRGKWRVLDSGTSGADGRFLAGVVLNRARDYKFRFLCPKTADTGAGVSRVIKVSAR
jgi:hypothetical protein